MGRRDMNEFPRRFGKYHLLGPLARAAWERCTSRCRDRTSRKTCVIKTVLPHLADAEYVARFRDEAKVVVHCRTAT